MRFTGNLLLCLLLTGSALYAQTPKNVIFIVVDDLNDYAFQDGHPDSYAPNIAELASRGTQFTAAYCSSPLCAPSRISFMTGKDLEYTRIYGNSKTLKFRKFFGPATSNETIYTLPEIMKDTGNYYTVGINKIYHNFFRPEFDNDYDGNTTDPCKKNLSWSEYIKIPDDPGLVPVNNGLGSYGWGKVPNSQESLMADFKAVDAAIKFLQNLEMSSAGICNRPFFMALGLVKPHTPHIVPAKYFPDDYVDNIYSTPFDIPYNDPFNQYPPNGFIMAPQPEDSLWSDFETLPSVAKVMARENINRHDAFINYAQSLGFLPEIDPSLTDNERRIILAESKRANASMAYWASVRYADAQIGRLMAHLDGNPGMRDNTIIVLLSDHGYSLGEKSHWHKQALWETDTRIPLLIIDPSRPGGQTCKRVVSALDIFPTILELTGVNEPTFADGTNYLDGVSLIPLLDDPNRHWERPALSTIKMGIGVSDGVCFPQFSVRSETHHYIRYKTDGAPTCAPGLSVEQEELYELGTDRQLDANEWNNLAENNDYSIVKNYLAEWLPGGSRYLSNNMSIKVQLDAVPCQITHADTIFVSAVLYDELGQETEPPAGTSVRFRTIPFNELYVGDSIAVQMGALDSTFFQSIDELEFQAVLYNSSAGVLAFDSKHVPINGGVTPSSNWNLQVEGNQVGIRDLEIDGRFNHTYWEFGDTYRSDDFWSGTFDKRFQTLPADHTYSFPGTYDISHHLMYGADPDKQCESISSQTVVMEDSLFEGLPCQIPGLLRMESLDGDQALVRWAPVFADESYELRMNRSSEFDVPFDFFYSNVPTTFVNGLEAGEEYNISVRAICDTSRTSTRFSKWSFPFRQRAVPCPPPSNVSLDSLTENFAVLSWDPVPEVEFYEIAYRKDGDPFIVFPVGQVNRIRLDDLESGSIYGFGVRTHCGQLFSQEAFPGDFTDPINFLIPGIPAREAAAVSGSAKDVQSMGKVDLFPNPTDGVIHVQYHAVQKPSGEAVLDVFDLNGKVVIDQKQTFQRSSGNWKVNLSGLDAGVYLVRVIVDQDMFVRQVVVE